MPNHTYTKKIGGDSIDLFLVFQVERETVMTADVVSAGKMIEARVKQGKIEVAEAKK